MSFIDYRTSQSKQYYGSIPGDPSLPPLYSPGVSRYPQTSPNGVGGFAISSYSQHMASTLVFFSDVDVDRSGTISARELQRAFINGDWSHFDLDTVKLLMSLFDADKSGDLNFVEFASLWGYIQEWERVFRRFDRDSSGTIDGSELYSALSHFGLRFPRHLIPLLLAKFASSPPGYRVGQQTITFDRFMRACVFVKQFSDAFGMLPKDKDGYVWFDYDQFLRFYFSLP
ncbi:hypothetical protein BGW80DRAFT_1293629 [Lactifluus volemus]|nr:hypothetical protein BGW80DRAFT_1293629 [Lactifluus volemus]